MEILKHKDYISTTDYCTDKENNESIKNINKNTEKDNICPIYDLRGKLSKQKNSSSSGNNIYYFYFLFFIIYI